MERAGQNKMPLEKLHKELVIHLFFTKGRSNGTNIRIKFYLNRGSQEPEIYIANIPGVSNVNKIKFNEDKLSRGFPFNYSRTLRTTSWKTLISSLV